LVVGCHQICRKNPYKKNFFLWGGGGGFAPQNPPEYAPALGYTPEVTLGHTPRVTPGVYPYGFHWVYQATSPWCIILIFFNTKILNLQVIYPWRAYVTSQHLYIFYFIFFFVEFASSGNFQLFVNDIFEQPSIFIFTHSFIHPTIHFIIICVSKLDEIVSFWMMEINLKLKRSKTQHFKFWCCIWWIILNSMKNGKGHRTSPVKKNLHFNPYSWQKLSP